MQYFIPSNRVSFQEEIKKSRFITYIQHTAGREEAKAFWLDIKKMHPDARHHCWATVSLAPNLSQGYGFSDDGEPNGTAGKPMLACLQGSQMGEISGVVVRYFGGVLLGTGGLVRAYTHGVIEALKLIQPILKIPYQSCKLCVEYSDIALIQTLCQRYKGKIISQDFHHYVGFTLAIPLEQYANFQKDLCNQSRGKLDLTPC